MVMCSGQEGMVNGLGRVKNGQMQSSIFVVGFYFESCNSSRSSKRGFSGDNECDGC